MGEDEIESMSKQLKIADNISSNLTEENLDKFRDNRSLTEKLNSIRGRDE